MVAATVWLAQTILATLLTDKLEAWIRGVGLADEIEKLNSVIRRIKIVLATVKEREIENEPLADSLALLQDLLYDADNLVDDLDYYRLQQQVQRFTVDEPEVMHGAERVGEIPSGDATMNSSVGKLRSVVWEYFTITEKDNGRPSKAKCAYCGEEFKCETKVNGTSSMKKHLEKVHSITFTKKPSGTYAPNPSSAGEPIVIGSPSRMGKGKKRRSRAWDLVVIIEEENGKPIKAICNYCAIQIKCGGTTGTAGILNHHKICKKKPGPNDQPSNPSSIADASARMTPTIVGDLSSRKKVRVDKESTQITAARPTVVGDSSSIKRGRVDEESTKITATNIHAPGDKFTLSNRIQKITIQLQDILKEVGEALKLHGSDSASSSNRHQTTGSDQYLKTSSLVTRKVYGRVAEKNSIIKMITESKSDRVTVVPIVGIAGVGKTALAQLVYNDPDVKTQFHPRIWVCVSRNFDKLRITTEMLDFVSRERHEGSTCEIERHEGIRSSVKLQEILKEHMEYQLKKFLLILDDVWENFDDHLFYELLAPLTSSDVKGNVILVTTRNFSVAQKIGTVKPVKLGALANDDFWLLFKSLAFGDKNYKGSQSQSIIGRQIADKLKGNPLAAETAGLLLRHRLSIDHWRDILMNEDWKSLQLRRGIMSALKLSYDQLPYHLQQCFWFSSIFPDNYQFLGEELVHIWVSLGFVICNHSSTRLEQIGQSYLTDLVNMGFIQQVGEQEEESSLGSQSSYSICGLMHDFARMVSRSFCATIDDLPLTKMLPTIKHLSVVTDSAYIKDQLGHIRRNNKFEEKLRNTVISARKLRTLVLIGKYDSHFFQVFQDKFRTAHNLRLLQVSATSADFNSLMYSLVDPTHLRYVKHMSDGLDGALPRILDRLFHLQVLDVGSNNNSSVPDGMHNLVSLRHLVAGKGVHSSIASIGSMTSLQELRDFKVQFLSSSFGISQLQSMNELVELGVSQLDNVESRQEAYGARLRDKVHMKKLCLSWKDALSYGEYNSYSRSESSMGTPREVLEGLEPHMDLQHLQISGYIGTTSPTWLASNISVTSLQTLHLDGCGGWRILPSLGSLPFLSKLKLSSMWEVTEVLVPSLEEIVLTKMPKLVRCSSTSVEGLSSSLRALQIEKCQALKAFDLFDELKIEQSSWLPGLRKLVLSDCPHLKVLMPLPPSATVSELLITGVSVFPSVKGSCNENLCIGYGDGDDDGEYENKYRFDKYSDELRVLDNKILAFHNLRSLKLMRLDGCQNLSAFSFEGFSHLVSLVSLEIWRCGKLFSSDVMLDATHEDVTAANCKAFPSLETLSIRLCGITGKWLSILLRHAPDLEELHLEEILSIEEGYSLSGEQDDTLPGLAQHRLVHIPLNLVSSLKKIAITGCPGPTFNWREEGFSVFTSLQKLKVCECPKLFSSLVHKDGNDDQANGRCLLPASIEKFQIICSYYEKTLRPCFPSDVTNLRKLEVRGCPDLESLEMHSCKALKELMIIDCESLTTLEGLQFLGSLGRLKIHTCPRLVSKDGNDEQENGRWLLPKSLWELDICSCSLKTLEPCFPSDLTSLKKLKIQFCRALESLRLVSCTALAELTIKFCDSLTALEGLQSHVSLRHLNVSNCPGLLPWLESFSRQDYELCSRLETLEIDDPSVLTTLFCEHLTSLRRLKLVRLVLTEEQRTALVLLKSLQQLEFCHCSYLVDLPAELHLLPSLKRLKISSCERISRLPEAGLPLSLEELEIEYCSKEVADQCRTLATSKLNVKIGYCR